MSTMSVLDPAIEQLRADLAEIAARVLREDRRPPRSYDYPVTCNLPPITLADLIREGSTVTEQEVGGWVSNGKACALSAAWLAAKARGIL